MSTAARAADVTDEDSVGSLIPVRMAAVRSRDMFRGRVGRSWTAYGSSSIPKSAADFRVLELQALA